MYFTFITGIIFNITQFFMHSKQNSNIAANNQFIIMILYQCSKCIQQQQQQQKNCMTQKMFIHCSFQSILMMMHGVVVIRCINIILYAVYISFNLTKMKWVSMMRHGLKTRLKIIALIYNWSIWMVWMNGNIISFITDWKQLIGFFLFQWAQQQHKKNSEETEHQARFFCNRRSFT